jgi:peptide-methionine (R)-S-oxide reductase
MKRSAIPLLLILSIAVMKVMANNDENQSSQVASNSSDSSRAEASATGAGSKAEKTAVDHEKQIQEILKRHPLQPNPRGQLRQGKYFNELNRFEKYVLEGKGTENRFSGEYVKNKKEGTYICRRCNYPLYRSTDKFESDCGWPSFDDEIPGTVTRIPDPDGHRTEIVCTHCGGHQGHVFLGERFTQKNLRHCVNSVSIIHIPKDKPLPEIRSELKSGQLKKESNEKSSSAGSSSTKFED